MRIAHLSDIHFTCWPKVHQMSFKRLLGTANLILRRRKQDFPLSVQQRLVEHVQSLQPDAVIITGDLTGQALNHEFELALHTLKPLLERFPSFVIPGNHDVYTLAAHRNRRMEAFFGPWMALTGDSMPVTRMDMGQVTLLGVNPCRPAILASGRLPDDQLQRLEQLLESPELTDRTVLLCIHYPIVDRKGAIYDSHAHGLLNAGPVVEMLQRVSQPPTAVLHGHVHHGYTLALAGTQRKVQILNSGSSGYAYQPLRQRAATMNVYTVGNQQIQKIEHHVFNGSDFVTTA